MSAKPPKDTGRVEKAEENYPLATLIAARRGPGTTGYTWDLQAVEDVVAEVGTKREHLEAALMVSHDTLTRRLKDDPGFIAAYERGLDRYRMKHMRRLDIMADKNPLIALAIANQPHILGWTNGRQEVTGKIEHTHTISPAMQAFANARVSRQARDGGKPLPSLIPDKESVAEGVMVEVTDPKE